MSGKLEKAGEAAGEAPGGEPGGEAALAGLPSRCGPEEPLAKGLARPGSARRGGEAGRARHPAAPRAAPRLLSRRPGPGERRGCAAPAAALSPPPRCPARTLVFVRLCVFFWSVFVLFVSLFPLYFCPLFLLLLLLFSPPSSFFPYRPFNVAKHQQSRGAATLWGLPAAIHCNFSNFSSSGGFVRDQKRTSPWAEGGGNLLIFSSFLARLSLGRLPSSGGRGEAAELSPAGPGSAEPGRVVPLCFWSRVWFSAGTWGG